jgi:zona occludens toxin (predicted ATPase)
MIVAYTGLPGGGKSLSALQDYLLPQLVKERHVFSNIVGLDPMAIAGRLYMTTSQVNVYLHRFSMSFDDDRAESMKIFKFREKDGSFYYANSEGLVLLVSDVMKYSEAVLILDECHEYLSPMNFRLLEPVKKYISMARHYGHDLVLITQHVSDIWEPIARRVHETHNFVRGFLGFRGRYTEIAYHGINIFAMPRYSKGRVNDKSLYCLYQSHKEGAREHLSYMSIWSNRKFVAFAAMALLMLGVGFSWLFSQGGPFGWVDDSPADKIVADLSAPKYNQRDNVVYVKYVVCGNYDCTAVRPDGSSVKLPLDYDSGKYPVSIVRFSNVQNGNGGSVFGGLPASVRPAAGGGVQNAPR